jgi:peptidoglycan/xylan/chitin deacetylase (PgdA/CDA1 family)
LRGLEVSATFFLLGEMLEHSPDLGRRLVDEGHEVAVHAWTHRSMLLRTPAGAYDELARTRDLIEQVTGSRPRFFRPPYGVLSSGALLAARRAGLQTVLWTGWGEDWSAKATAMSVLDTLDPDIAGGATLLLHDSDCTSAAGAWHSALGALPLVVERCRDLGCRVGPLREHGLPVR